MKWRWPLGILILVLVGFFARLATVPVAPDIDDSLLFVAAVLRFSIAETRPHWPGYPVYIWVGKVANALVGDPVLGLHLVSIAASALLTWPLASVSRMWARSLGAQKGGPDWCGLAAGALWLATPMSWVTGSQILSDPLGLLCAFLVLALCLHGERNSTGARHWTAAAALGGVMVGIRLVNVTLLAPLLWACWRRRRERWFRLPAPLVLFTAFAVGVLPWLVWMSWPQPAAVVRAGESHLLGHFGRWGQSLATDTAPLGRIGRAFATLAIYGIGAGTPAQGWWRVTAGIAWVTVLVMVGGRTPWRSAQGPLIALWGAPHLLYLFVAHDVAYPRYMMSPVAMLCLLGGLAATSPGAVGRVAILLAIASMAAVSGPLAWRQRHEPPVEYRVARFVQDRPRAAIAISDEPLLLFYIGRVSANAEWAAVTPSTIVQWQTRWEAAGRPVFSTTTPPDSRGWHPVAHFCRDPLIDPRMGHDVWLFAPPSTSTTAAFDACD